MSNLGPQIVKDSYQNLVQITSSNALQKGDGTDIIDIVFTNVTASNVDITGKLEQGLNVVASGFGSHAQGGASQALGTFSHAEGNTTTANAVASHAEGAATIANGISSHAEGNNTTANGNNSHAEGDSTIANGLSSHTEGLGTIADGDYQLTIGQYNTPSSAQSAFIIGNGADNSNRSNLLFAQGSQVQITGSLNVNGSITGSLFGTSSWAVNALTASVLSNINPNVFVQDGNSFGTTAVLGTNDDNNLELETNGSTRLFISSSGNVGIGTTTPNYTLDVSGSGNFTEDVYISGSLEFEGSTNNLYLAPSTDVRNWYLTGKNFNISSQEGSSTGIYFKDDGTRFYIIGTGADRVFQYDLSTAWNVSTAVYNSVNLSVGSQDSTPNDIFISPDGTILFMLGDTNDRVYRYNLSSAWDVSSATFVNSFSVSAEETNPNGLYFDPTGTNMYVIGTNGDDVNQYTLGTAWDLTTVSFLQTFSVASQESTPIAISFNNAGTRMYILGQSGDDITEYRLSTPWDISTATFFTTGFTGPETTPGGLYYNETYEVAYIVGSSADVVYGLATTPQLKYYGDSFIMDSQMFVGGRTEIAGTLYVNNAITATSNITTAGSLVSSNASFSTSTISLGTGTSTTTVNIGGNASLSSTNRFGYGAITSGLTKTIEIGTGGLTGSITNTIIGSGVSGGKILLAQNTEFAQNTTVRTTLNVDNNANILDSAQSASGEIVVFDTFTEASNTLLNLHTPDTGSGWSRNQISTFTSPTMTVFGATNTAGPTANVTDQGVIYRQDTVLTTPNYEVSVDLVTQDSSDDVLWLFARYQDVNNFYGVAWSTTQANCRLVRRVSGTFTTLSTLSVAPITGATTLSIRVLDNLIVVLNGGNVVISAFDTNITNAGYAAIGGGNIGQTSSDDFDATWKFDNFKVRYYQAGAQTSNITGGLNISGNVGIGTSSPSQKLEVRDGFVLVSGSGPSGYGYLLNRAGQDSYAIRHLDGGLTISNETDNRKEMTFLGNGNVGIGTTSPQRRLHIDASGSSNPATPLILTSVDTNNRVGIQFASSSIASGKTHSLIHRVQSPQVEWILGASAGESAQWQFQPQDNSTLALTILTPFNGGTARIFTGQSQSLFALGAGAANNHLVISSSGNVGIGTATPTQKLHILNGNILLNDTYYIDWANGSERIIGGGSGTGYSLQFLTYDGANITEKMRISGSGNVGIGTTNPLSLLHISASSGNEFLRITSGSQNILNVRSGSVVFFAGTGVAPSSGFDFDIQGTGTANNGSVRINGNNTVYALSSQGSISRGSTGNIEMFGMIMGGTSTTVTKQNPLRVEFNANQGGTAGYAVLRLNATHITVGSGPKLLQTWEFAGVERSVVNITGSIGVGITTPSASIHISSSLGLPPMLALTPHHPLPTTGVPTGSFMVSSSTPPRPYMWDGTSWYAL